MPSLPQLFPHLHLTTADTLPQPKAKSQPNQNFPPLPRGQLHEWFATAPELAPTPHHWHPPLTLLTLLAARAATARHRRILFVGRNTWPTFQLLAANFQPGGTLPHGRSNLGRHLFLDPLTPAERFWAIAQALRCPSIAAIIADASGLDSTISRRLQLAAEQGNRDAPGPLALLARPPQEMNLPSWAATRWAVSSAPPAPLIPPALGASHSIENSKSNIENPSAFRWHIELLNCRGQRPGHDAPSCWTLDWTYQVFLGSGALHFSPRVGSSTHRPQSLDSHAPKARIA